jgi:hypothetical protein
MLAEHFFGGIIVVEAFHVTSYWPHPLVLPHVHVLVRADEVTRETLANLRALVAAYRGQQWHSIKKRWVEAERPEWIRAEPTTRTYQLDEEHNLCAVLNYLSKPINWAERYLNEWGQVPHGDRIFFNQNVVEVIDGWCCSRMGNRDDMSRRQHYCLGELQHAHKGFVGVPAKKRDSAAHDLQFRELLTECNAQQSLDFCPEDFGEPIEFQTSPE